MRVLLYGAVLGAGFLLTGLTAVAVWNVWTALRQAPAAPIETTVDAAGEGRWVRPTDLALRCDTRVEARGFTFVLAEGGPSRTPVAVHLVGNVPCPAAAPSGVFAPGRFSRRWFRETFDVAFPGTDAEGADVRLLTEALAPEYQRKALLRILPWLGFGLLMSFVGGRGLLRARRAARPRAPQ